MKRMLVISIVVMFAAGVLFPTGAFAADGVKATKNVQIATPTKHASGNLAVVERILKWIGLDTPLFGQTDPNAPPDPTDNPGYAIDEKTGLLSPTDPNAPLEPGQAPYDDDREPPTTR